MKHVPLSPLPDVPLVLSRVDRTYRRIADHLQQVTIHCSDGQEQTLHTTDEHPFYVVGKGWTKAGELEAGDLLQEPDGSTSTVLSSIREEHPEGVTVFNLRVENTHSYFVRAEGSTAEPVWVHNAGAGYEVRSLQAQTELHGFFEDAMREAAADTGGKYSTLLDMVGRGETPTGQHWADAFSDVSSRFWDKAANTGYDPGVLHHWNFPKNEFPEQVFDPRNLFVVADSDMHYAVHMLVTEGSGLPYNGPMNPAYVTHLPDNAYRLAPR